MRKKNVGERVYEKILELIIKRVLELEEAAADSLFFWRIHVLFSILFTGIVIGFFSLLTGLPMMMEKQLWGLLFIDAGIWCFGVVLVAWPGIRFRIRCGCVLAAIYGLGVAIIFNVGCSAEDLSPSLPFPFWPAS